MISVAVIPPSELNDLLIEAIEAADLPEGVGNPYLQQLKHIVLDVDQLGIIEEIHRDLDRCPANGPS